MQISQIEQAKYILTALQGNFQAFQWRNHGGYDMDSQLIWWDSSNALPVGELAINFGRIKDPVIDKALADNRGATDPAVKKELAETVNKQFGDGVLQPLGLLDGVGHPAHAEGEGCGRVHASERRPSQPGHRRNVRRAVGLDRPQRLVDERKVTA